MLVGDHNTVPLTRVSCNRVFSKSQNAHKAGPSVMLHLTCMPSGAKMGETIVTHCFYTECHISSFYLRVGFSKIRKSNVFYNNFKLPSHTYSDNQSPIIPQDVAARLVIQQRAQCVTIFSPFFAPLDMRVTCNITFIILDVRICHLEDKGIFSLHAQSK